MKCGDTFCTRFLVTAITDSSESWLVLADPSRPSWSLLSLLSPGWQVIVRPGKEPNWSSSLVRSWAQQCPVCSVVQCSAGRKFKNRQLWAGCPPPTADWATASAAGQQHSATFQHQWLYGLVQIEYRDLWTALHTWQTWDTDTLTQHQRTLCWL